MLQPRSRRREKTWHEMIRAVLRGGPLSSEPPKFKAAANMRSSGSDDLKNEASQNCSQGTHVAE
jgi:hypothetical protein